MKNKLLCIIALSGSLSLRAQTITPDVLVSAGGYSSSAGNSIAWAIGEAFSETYSSANNFLTQGFHQPQEAGIISVHEHPVLNSVIAYPNPLLDNLHLYFGRTEGNFLIRIFDISGKQVFSESVSANHLPGKTHHIPFSLYSAGPYHLQLINIATQLKTTYTIIKQQ
jgi:hypothetical protein